jgi:Ankyrin repeats (3 copies)
VEGLRQHLAQHPKIARQRVTFDGGNYFRTPTLLEFIAENPVRHGRLPANIVQVAEVILAAGVDQTALHEALGLVVSGRVPRECGVQLPLIDLLCEQGADTQGALRVAALHGEMEAVNALLRRGGRLDLPVAAALGRLDDFKRLLEAASKEDRHVALALAAQFGHVEMVRMLLDAGEDPNRYNHGAHSHSTPLHQAAYYGHDGVVQLLIERGARLDIKDLMYQGTAADWAYHGGRTELEEYLRAKMRK